MTHSDRSDISIAANGHMDAARGRRGPVRLLLSLFSSIWLGVTLLALLFIYSSIGSAGAPIGEGMLRPWFILNPDAWVAVRQKPWFDMTEFEWFHWWPFDTLIALICINLVVATLRRIPLNVINLGVWMIHTGIITLCLGSVWYFSTKVEGDAPVARRRVVVELPGQPPQSISALPGNRMMIGKGEDAYILQISNIDPNWELLSGDDKGKYGYKASVTVQSKGGMFIRELVAGKPEYTQDVVRSNDPNQPFVRAIKALGKPLVDETIRLSLDYDPQIYFYLVDSRAVYLRELDAQGMPKSDWVQRPIGTHSGLPRYNDRIASFNDVWELGDNDDLRPRPLDVAVPPVDPNDPFPQTTFHISRYLRYAHLETRRRRAPDAPLNPAVSVRLQSNGTGESSSYQLVAFSPDERSALRNSLLFTWVDSAGALEKLKQRIDPVIRFRVPSASVDVEHAITQFSSANPDLAFTPIEGTEYSYRVESTQTLTDKGLSVAIVEIKTPERSFKRWVFDDPSKNRDLAMTQGLAQHEAGIPLDEKLQTALTPGSLPPAPIMILAGPGEDDLAVMITKAVGQPQFHAVKVGDSVPVTGSVSLIVDKYAARTANETRPLVVPREQRDRDLREFMSMIKLDIPASSNSTDAGQSDRHPDPVPGGEGVTSFWLPYHHYAFAAPDEVLRRFPYRPQPVTLPDGRQIEFMFSRERLRLPAPVALEDFQVASHIGGFTGQTSSIMDWISVVRFASSQGWGESKNVQVNKPAEHDGYWFFQAQWDPPDRARFQGDTDSRGLNYTVLGVGNRNGVHVQLAGCCIAVMGMIYAFYVKPIIKRRRQQKVYASIAADEIELDRADRPQPQPVGAAWKVES